MHKNVNKSAKILIRFSEKSRIVLKVLKGEFLKKTLNVPSTSGLRKANNSGTSW